MKISYKPLMHKLVEREMNKTTLCENANISYNVISKINKSETISMESIGKICIALNCTPNDIFEIIEEDK